MLEVPLGVSDFEKMIRGNYLFVDTTPFIGEIFREGSDERSSLFFQSMYFPILTVRAPASRAYA